MNGLKEMIVIKAVIFDVDGTLVDSGSVAETFRTTQDIEAADNS
jgi:phosphoglycolate phosphatase-like HAD superfamily hydrolase